MRILRLHVYYDFAGYASGACQTQGKLSLRLHELYAGMR